MPEWRERRGDASARREPAAMHVSRLQITPVKGTDLHDVASVDLGIDGIAEDRRFYLVDSAGLMFNGKRDGRLVRVRATYDPANARRAIRFPDGRVVAASLAFTESITTSFYGNPVAGHLVAGPWSEALAAFLGQPVRLVQADRPGNAVDVHPVTMLSRGSIERLGARAAAMTHLERRFRMLVEIDGAAPYGEDSWRGRDVAIGAAVVSVVGPVPRCVVVSQNPQTGLRDYADALRVIFEERGAMSADLTTPTAHLPDGGKIVFGVYGSVVTPGRIAVGDTIALA